MTDKELIAAAGKAAGIDLVPYTWNKGTGWDHEGFTVAGESEYEWNPLENNDEAFNLAVALRLVVDVGSEAAHVFNDDPGVVEPHNGDPYAATRRAIVRQAAAMVERGVLVLPNVI